MTARRSTPNRQCQTVLTKSPARRARTICRWAIGPGNACLELLTGPAHYRRCPPCRGGKSDGSDARGMAKRWHVGPGQSTAVPSGSLRLSPCVRVLVPGLVFDLKSRCFFNWSLGPRTLRRFSDKIHDGPAPTGRCLAIERRERHD